MTQTSPKSNTPEPISSESLFGDMDTFPDAFDVALNDSPSEGSLFEMENPGTEGGIIADWGLEPGQVNPSEPLLVTTDMEDFKGLDVPVAEESSDPVTALLADSWGKKTEVKPTISSTPEASSEDTLFSLVSPAAPTLESEEPERVAVPATFSPPSLPTFSAVPVTATPTTPPKISTFTPPPVSVAPSPLASPSPRPPVSQASWWQKQSFRSKAVIIALVLSVIPVGIVGGINYSMVDSTFKNAQSNTLESSSSELKGKLQMSLLFSLLLTAGVVGAIAYLLAERSNKATHDLAQRTKQLGQTHLHYQNLATGEDELGAIDATVTAFSEELDSLRQEQVVTQQQVQLLSDLANSKLTDQNALAEVLQTALDKTKELLGLDRIIFYYLPKNQSQTLIYEAVNHPYTAIATESEDFPDFLSEGARQIQQIDKVNQANLSVEYQDWLVQNHVKSSLALPLLRLDQVCGLLAFHHCQKSVPWQPREKQFLHQLSEQLQGTMERVSLLQQRRDATKQSQMLKTITLQITSALNSDEVFDIAVNEIRRALKSDRVIIYRFDASWAGTIIAESVADQFPKALGAQIKDPCFAEKYVDKYREGRVQATSNIYDAGLTPCHLGQLAPFGVKANLVGPIIRKGELLGLLIAHQCSAPRDWEQNEIDFFSQLSTQVGLALERTDLVQQLRSAESEQRLVREKLQKRAMELLMEVDPVSRGDLTIRAHVTEDEIGTIADSYNATIENLRRIVTQVQEAATQFASTTDTNETSVRNLSEEAIRQAEDIAGALESLQAMTLSIQDVAANAEMAEVAVQQATQTVDAGEDAMNRTVDGILAIRETVAATAKKVKRLGESSQKISKVVNLISSFADQTNLLALNAAIEAAHAGEEGRGFAVVADEVRSLARQSAEATAEIAELVASIQSETNEVVIAMETGTEQVVMGTKLVDETRKSLNLITAASAQISELVGAIAAAAVEQSQTSQAVTQTMAQVAAISDKTSFEAAHVSDAFKELLAVAQSLQDSVRQFKVS